MNIYRGIEQLPADFGPVVATIGNFDGVHRGHRMVIAEVIAAKQEKVLVFPQFRELAGPLSLAYILLVADELGVVLDEDAPGLVPPWLHPATSTTAASPIARVTACVRGGAIRPCCHGGSPLRSGPNRDAPMRIVCPTLKSESC